jgi:hypothetical protein
MNNNHLCIEVLAYVLLKPPQPQKENKLLENWLTKLLSNVINNDCDGEGQP